MLYLHDLWVNWIEGEENGYNVCHYHEWRKSDQIELLDQIPLLYITENLYQFIENDMQELPTKLLDTIYQKTYIRKGQNRNVLDYACVVTDGKDIITMDTVGYYIPIRKSRLIPRQEKLVFDMIKEADQQSFSFVHAEYEKEYTITSMAPQLIFGLTRKERQLKQLMMIALDQIHTTNHLGELRYWLTEWSPKKYPLIRFMNEEQVWDALFEGVKYGWSLYHEELCLKLIKGQPYLEKIWEEEQKLQGTSKLR